MSRLALFLLGPPRIELDGKPVQIPRRKALALPVYLAVTGRSHSRDSLATLLWHINLSAPRIVRPAPGDLAVQTVCAPVSDERPAIGGLLLWKDKENYLRLDRGAVGEHDILFSGCLDNQDVVIDRGRLPFDKSANQQISKSSGRVLHRLERVGDRVDALCSADGERWFHRWTHSVSRRGPGSSWSARHRRHRSLHLPRRISRRDGDPVRLVPVVGSEPLDPLRSAEQR